MNARPPIPVASGNGELLCEAGDRFKQDWLHSPPMACIGRALREQFGRDQRGPLLS